MLSSNFLSWVLPGRSYDSFNKSSIPVTRPDGRISQLSCCSLPGGIYGDTSKNVLTIVYRNIFDSTVEIRQGLISLINITRNFEKSVTIVKEVDYVG